MSKDPSNGAKGPWRAFSYLEKVLEQAGKLRSETLLYTLLVILVIAGLVTFGHMPGISGSAASEGVRDVAQIIALLAALGLVAHMVAHLVAARTGGGKTPPERSRLEPLRRDPEDKRLRVGVLSFADVGQGADEEAYGDGFSAEIIARLRRIEQLNPVPREFMIRVRERGMTLPQITTYLAADYLVEGTLQKHGERSKVDARVIRADTLEYVWDGQWKRPWPELFDLQTDVAHGVGAYLLGVAQPDRATALHPDERSSLQQPPAESVGAFSAHAIARANLRLFNKGRKSIHFRAAEAAFQDAIRLDPSYLDAHAGLGFLYLLQWETQGGPVWLDRSELAFRKVVGRQEDHPIAMAELGYISYIRGDALEGLRLAERASASHPGETIPQNVLALLYMYAGFYEAAVEWTESRVLDLDANYVYPPTNASTCCLLLGRYDEAVAWARRAQAIDPAAFIAHLVEGAAHFHADDHRAARRAWNRGLDVAPDDIDPIFEVALAWITAAQGDARAARAVVAERRHDDWIDGAYDPYFISLCALAGQLELAMDLLERQATYAGSYRYLVSDRTLRPLRDHPGFPGLLERRYEAWRVLEPTWNTLPLAPAAPPSPAEFLERAVAGNG